MYSKYHKYFSQKKQDNGLKDIKYETDFLFIFFSFFNFGHLLNPSVVLFSFDSINYPNSYNSCFLQGRKIPTILKRAHMTSFGRYSFVSSLFSSDNPTDAQDQHPWSHLLLLLSSRTFRLPCIHARWPHSSNSSAGLLFFLSLSFYGQKSTWPAKIKGEVEKEKKVRWGKGGGRWKKPLSVTVWFRPFSFRRHSLPVRLFLWSACTKRSFTCSPPREGKILSPPSKNLFSLLFAISNSKVPYCLFGFFRRSCS